METTPAPKLTNDLVLLCPSCHINIPHLTPIIEQNQTFFNIKCSCSKDSLKLELRDYLAKLKVINNTVKPNCYKSNHTKEAIKYCTKCQHWLCSKCLEYHQEFTKNHILQDKKVITVCTIHKENYKYYCKVCDISICDECNEHNEHLKEIIDSIDLLQEYNEQKDDINKILLDQQKQRQEFNQAIDKTIDHLLDYKEKLNKIYVDNSIILNQIIELCSIINYTSTIIPKNASYSFNQTLLSLAENSFIKLNLNTSVIDDYNKILTEKHTIDQIEMKPSPFYMPTLSIIHDMKDLIKSSIDNSPKTTLKFKLLFSAKTHGDSIKAFHENCDNQGPTVTIIETTKGKKFGGYTSKSWGSISQEYQRDSQAFLFSLNLQKIYPILKTDKAIYCAYNYGPDFGSGSDIHIADRCLSNDKSHCKFPTSYSNGNDNEMNGNESNFTVDNYSVFQVIIS